MRRELCYRAPALCLAMCLYGVIAHADTIVQQSTSAFANDFVTWAQLGSDGATIPHAFSAVSNHGDLVTGDFSTTTGLVAVVGGSWGPPSGPFVLNDTVIWAYDNSPSVNNGTGPVTFVFPSGYGAGAAVQADSPGAFTAKLELFNGTTSLGFVTQQSDAAGDAVYIAALDSTGPSVTSATFSLLSGTNTNKESNYLGDFAIDTLALRNQGQAVAPEPGTVLLLGSALLGLGLKGLSRRRK